MRNVVPLCRKYTASVREVSENGTMSVASVMVGLEKNKLSDKEIEERFGKVIGSCAAYT